MIEYKKVENSAGGKELSAEEIKARVTERIPVAFAILRTFISG